MFFIGIFGINRTEKTIGEYSSSLCPSCHSISNFEIIKEYSYFHFFFIPVYKWNIKYYIKPDSGSSIYELESSIGQLYEKGERPQIREEDLHPVQTLLPNKVCRYCQSNVESGYSYCPFCGKKL